MAKKISQLTQATEVKSDDVTVIVQDGETKKLPLNMMVTKQDIENKKIAGLAKLDEIEATYENDTYTPTITVKNKSSVKTGEGDEVDYSANVMDGHAKSAILSGNTLVNVFSNATVHFTTNATHTGNKTINLTSTEEVCHSWWNVDLQTTKQYMLSINIIENTSTVNLIIKTGDEKTLKIFDVGVTGKQIIIFTPTNSDIRFKHELLNTGTTVIDEIMLIEYQEGMENWDIPYFEGMQSVKMPVLTTTGKNLSPINDYETTVWEYAQGHQGFNKVLAKNILVNENKEYRLSFTKECEDGLPTNLGNLTVQFSSIPVSSNINDHNAVYIHCQNNKGKKYAHITMPNIGQGNTYVGKRVTLTNIQLEEGSVTTSYEPYKTNILSTPSDLELRGIGDVQDTLDLVTGEVTERIGEIILDGSDIAYTNNNGYMTEVSTAILTSAFSNCMLYQPIMCKDFPVYSHNEFIWEKRYGIVSGVSFVSTLWGFCIRLPHTLTGVSTVDSEDTVKQKFKAYLQSNPITIQYQFETPTIKTVDLMPSGTHPSTTPYCWKNGHIQLSSSGLLPNLEYSVVTSRAGQINQNATMIVKNDKRIFDLEILLAGGLVNTTYQALTLQNQVETGLSKVSLNSEKEPDYLLYHMIMKLIEEKAYKLDDLTEKVSVFYLYEKLSDEQFETIYSALYPFVEDEIIEEPVVEELPEVVEDEVIM